MWRNIFLVGIGSFAGGVLRYLVSLGTQAARLRWAESVIWQSAFPWATFAVNLLGCLLIGLLMGWSTRLSQEWTLLLTVGLCGGFTTFSTFSKESLLLMQTGSYGLSALYILGSLLLGIALVAAGWWMAK